MPQLCFQFFFGRIGISVDLENKVLPYPDRMALENRFDLLEDTPFRVPFRYWNPTFVGPQRVSYRRHVRHLAQRELVWGSWGYEHFHDFALDHYGYLTIHPDLMELAFEHFEFIRILQQDSLIGQYKKLVAYLESLNFHLQSSLDSRSASGESQEVYGMVLRNAKEGNSSREAALIAVRKNLIAFSRKFANNLFKEDDTVGFYTGVNYYLGEIAQSKNGDYSAKGLGRRLIVFLEGPSFRWFIGRDGTEADRDRVVARITEILDELPQGHGIWAESDFERLAIENLERLGPIDFNTLGFDSE